ncbi:threonine/serine exporter family protein [Fusobacterium sp. MFO224]|uniref:threonine/serine exporter family protein n=1 Tax=Fusobacterium sp. MFO224 TaxID=3378070 RepID=UPI0038523577
MIIQFIFSILSVVGFTIIFNVRGKIAFWSAIGGAIGWIIYLFTTELGFSIGISFFLAGAWITFVSQLVSIYFKTPITSALIPTLTPLVPGGGAYYTMFYLINKEYSLALKKGTETIVVCGAIILGFLVVSECFRLYLKKKQHVK